MPGLPEVFIIGDAMFLEQDGKPLPGVAQVPIQQGKYVAKLFMRRVQASPTCRRSATSTRATWRPWDASSPSTTLTSCARRAVSAFPGHSFLRLLDLAALARDPCHLPGRVRQPLPGDLQWAWSYLTFQRGARLIMPDEASYHADPERLLEEHGTPLPAALPSPAARDGKTPAPEREPASQAR